MGNEEIVIDRKTLKALGADTRLEILRVLHEHQRTLTELAAVLKMSHSTVKEHMEVLAQAELVKCDDAGRKWKYFSLTRKGLKIVAPEEVTALFVFGLSGLTVGALLAKEFLGRLASSIMPRIAPPSLQYSAEMAKSASGEGAADLLAATAPPAAEAASSGAQAALSLSAWDVALAIAVAACLASGAFLLVRMGKRRPKKPGEGESDES